MTIALNVNGDILDRVYSFKIEGNKYYFHVRYNQRVSSWQVCLYDSENNPLDNPDAELLLDLGRMMPNSALTWLYGLFSGEIVCVDTIGDKADVVKDNFGDGKQYQLVYFTEEETDTYQLSQWTTYKNV